MATGNFRHLIIADERRNVLGVVSDRDILLRAVHAATEEARRKHKFSKMSGAQ